MTLREQIGLEKYSKEQDFRIKSMADTTNVLRNRIRYLEAELNDAHAIIKQAEQWAGMWKAKCKALWLEEAATDVMQADIEKYRGYWLECNDEKLLAKAEVERLRKIGERKMKLIQELLEND